MRSKFKAHIAFDGLFKERYFYLNNLYINYRNCAYVHLNVRTKINPSTKNTAILRNKLFKYG